MKVKKKGIEGRIIEHIDLGDKDIALTLITKHYSKALLNVSYGYLGDIELSKDSLQDSMYKIWLNMDSYDCDKSTLYTWMYRIVINSSIDQFRLRSKSREKFIRDSNDYSYIDFHHSDSINIDVIDLVDHLNLLPLKNRDIIYLKYFKGLTEVDISEHLSIPLGTVKSRYRIGLRELRKIYTVK